LSDATEVLVQDTTIAARDGYALAATVFTPHAAPRGAVLINSATAVPRKIYRGFATYLAQQGFTVLSYDYRGTGGSRPASLRGFAVRMRDWAALDVAAAIAHMRQVWPQLPLAVVGHSFGGQAIGLVPNNTEISRVLLVASQAGYWGLLHSPERYRVYLMLRLVGSPVARMLGYMPGRLGIGEDLPRDVFLEWTGWVMKRRYFFDDTTLAALENFPRYRGALRAICLTDDPWATAPAVDLLCSGFTGTRPERIDIRPAAIGAGKIGHFGFFRPEHRGTLWRDAAGWLGGGSPAKTPPSS
jgi:predicted alpha/beta hydrolase